MRALTTQGFRLGGVTVSLEGQSRAQTAQLHAHLARLFTLTPATEPSDVKLRLETRALPEGSGELVYGANALEVRCLGSGFSLRCGASQLQLHGDGNALSAHCFLAPDFGFYTPYEQREFFLLGLLMLLRPHGCYGLHACGLERGGAGLLLVGTSGSGKTTTSLQLIQKGWRYLSDDAVLLRKEQGKVSAHAFRRGFSCTTQTLEHCPNLSGESEFGDPGGKRIVHLEHSAAGVKDAFTPHCTPSLIVFPTITGAATSSLRPLPAAQSLVRLCQQSAGIMTDVSVSQGQLAVLTTLALQARSLELLLGRDALTSPELVGTLLEPTLEVTLCASSSN